MVFNNENQGENNQINQENQMINENQGENNQIELENQMINENWPGDNQHVTMENGHDDLGNDLLIEHEVIINNLEDINLEIDEGDDMNFLEKINMVFSNGSIEELCVKWTVDKDLCFEKLTDFWEKKDQFKEDWMTLDSEIKSAIIATSFEETMEIEQYLNLYPLCCPELLDLNNLIYNPSTVIELFEVIINKKENDNFLKEEEEILIISQLISNIPLGEQMIKLARSCMLSNFLSSIQILYQEGIFDDNPEPLDDTIEELETVELEEKL